MIQVKRVYEPAAEQDGQRILVERLWPRGLKKSEVQFDQWIKEVAPTSDLRKWFGHNPEKWAEFQRRYRAELEEKREAWEPILAAAKKGKVTLLFSSRDTVYNNAMALKSYLDKENGSRSKKRKPAVPVASKRKGVVPVP